MSLNVLMLDLESTPLFINSSRHRDLSVSKIFVDKIADKGGVTKKASTNVNALLVDR